MPTSPALSGVGSPSLGPTSVPLSQQQAEKAKSARKPVVHLLALSAMSEKELQAKIPDVTKEELNQVLDRVGDLNQGTRKWELRKNFWKELDVWTFNYEKDEDRHTAINNAVKQYDRMRMSRSDLQWDQLLPKSERGTGKCLSKLQAQIAQGPIARAPKVNVEKAQDSGRDTGDEADLFGDKNLSKAKGENMARSASQPPTTKAKKVSDREAQAKRLLSGNTKKPAAPKPAPKPAPAKKEKPKAGTKVLSSQFVSESDDEDSYMISSKPVLAPKAPTKRPREEDSTTSDSSVPLSKKIKKDVPTSIHRTSNASQTSHTTNSSTLSSISAKSKGTNSAHKSSPLASSPPTNASEVESPAGRTSSSSASPAHPSIKTSRSPIHKRHRASSSTSSSSSSTSRYLRREVLELAARYKSFYPKYLALHKEVMSMDDYKRDRIKEKDLFDMHDRLTNMKKEIMQGVIEAEEIAGGM
jgi:RNA polymerase II elongation factor ELL